MEWFSSRISLGLAGAESDSTGQSHRNWAHKDSIFSSLDLVKLQGARIASAGVKSLAEGSGGGPVWNREGTVTQTGAEAGKRNLPPSFMLGFVSLQRGLLALREPRGNPL